MAGFTQNIFGRGKLKKNASNSISFAKYFENCSSFCDFILFFVPRFQRDPLWKYRIQVKYQLSNAFMTNNDKVLQDLIKQRLEDDKHLLDHENIVQGSTGTNSLSVSKLLPVTIRKCPSSKKLLGRPWLIKVRTNTEGKPPILKCYAIDEGEIIEVEGKPLLIPPVLGLEAKQEIWKPKGWKPIRQTLKLHEITPSPKCPKHQHLQKSKKYELIRETLLQATIVTTIKKEEQHPQQLLKELTRDTLNYRLRKLSGNFTSPNWIPPKWTMPKEETKDETTKEDESSTSESSSTSNSSSSDKEGASSEAKDKQKQEEEQKKQLEEKKKKKEKKKKIQDEKQRQWRLALREAAGQAAFAGTYASRVGGLGRPF